MRTRSWFLLAGAWLLFNACLPRISISRTATQTPFVITATPQPLPATDTPQAVKATDTQAAASEGLDHVNIYLVALDDSGVSGQVIGCGDSLVPVEVPIPPTLGVLRAALNELFALEGEQYYGESGLYNALYRSHLSIEDLAVVNGEATIHLKGSLVMGGECDNPRVQAQLEAAALQFSTVQHVSIFINGKPLEDILDLRG